MRRTSPTLESQAAASLAAGWGMSAVAEQTGLSVSTLRRIKQRTDTAPGSLRPALVAEAKACLIESLGAEFGQVQSAKLIRSQAALSERLSSLAWVFMERIERDAGELDPLKASRALASLGTTIKLAGDSLKQVLTLGAEPDLLEELPELVVRDMLEEEIAEVRAQQREQARAMGLVTEEEGC